MSANATMSVVSGWQRLALPATWLIGTFGAILTFPARIATDGMAPEVVAGIVGIVLTVAVAILQSRPLARRGRWPAVPLLISLTALFVAAWFAYSWLMQVWTCDYFQDARLVVGSTPQPDLVDYLRQSGRVWTEPMDCRLVKEYAGDTRRMFMPSEMGIRYASLLALYFSCWLLLISMIWQSVRLVRQRRTK